jgi:CRP-like cAMP-binding protein
MSMTREESRRLDVLSLVERAKITIARAAEALGRTRRELFRLLAKLRAGGPRRAPSPQRSGAGS